jgi:uncharacterized protein HemX
MQEQKTNTSKEPSHKEGDNATGTKQKAKTSSQSEKTNQSGQTNQNTNSNSPDWLMHLLSGAGALGGNYLLFIKPLQEKFDAMNQSIINQGKAIKEMQEQIDLVNHKIKKAKQKKEETKEQNEDELFATKRNDKTNPSPIHGTKRTVRF